MARFWKYIIALVALVLAGATYASASPGMTQPDAGPSDGMEVGRQLSCGAARDLLTRQSYQGVTVRSCFTSAYTFTIECNGNPVRIFVDPQNGRVWQG